LLQVVDLLSQVWNLRSLRLHDSQFTLVVTNFEFQKSDILKSLLILNFTSSESRLKNLDLLVKKGELIISSNELSTEDISFINDALEVLLQGLNLCVGFLYNIGQLGDLIVKIIFQIFSFFVFFLLGLQFTRDFLDLLLVNSFFMMLLGQSLVLSLNLILELGDLMRSDLELSLQLCNFVLSFDQVLRVKVSVTSYSLIQVLLLLQLAFKLDVLLLELTDEVLLELDLFNHLHEVCISFRSLMRETISIFLELIDLSKQLSNVFLLHSSLLL